MFFRGSTVDPAVARLFRFRLVRAHVVGVMAGLVALAAFGIASSGVLAGEVALDTQTVATALLVLLVAGLAMAFFSFVLVGPLASVLAWRPYVHGDKSYVTYVLLGAIAASSVAFAMALVLRGGAGDYASAVEALLFGWFGLWVAGSGAVGGWYFARQINTDV